MLLGKSDVIELDDLPRAVCGRGPIRVEPVGTRTLKEALEGPERQIILEVLEANQLEPPRHGRRAGHQPHHALQEDEAAGAGRRTTSGKCGISRLPVTPTQADCSNCQHSTHLGLDRRPKMNGGPATGRVCQRSLPSDERQRAPCHCWEYAMKRWILALLLLLSGSSALAVEERAFVAPHASETDARQLCRVHRHS